MVMDPSKALTHRMSPILRILPVDTLPVEQECLFFLLLEEILYTCPYNPYTHASGQSTTPGNAR